MIKVTIHPETRISELLEACPELEHTLVALAPAFQKLKNPLLRKTVAKVATLEQAARIGGLPVAELVRRLREAAGQISEASPGMPVQPDLAGEAPPWLGRAPVLFQVDGDELLEKGVHPIGRVRQFAAALRPGETLLLKTSFRPEPLIDTMRRGGFQVYSCQIEPARHHTYIRRPE